MSNRVAALVLAGGCAWASLTAPTVVAAPCSGFTDVDSASAFCPNVDWLRNRAITLGCTSSTLYCPGDPVSRLAMAAFMNRLGIALTPTVAYQEASGALLDLDNPPAAICATAALPSATYPRSARTGAVLTAHLAAGATAGLRIVQSIDGGTTWTPMNTLPASVGGTSKWVNGTVWKGGLALAPGTSYRFGLRVDRAGTGTGDLGAWNCQLEVIATTRTGSSAPF